MLREEIKELQRTGQRELRKFGLVVGGVFLLFSLLLVAMQSRPWWYWSLLLAGVPLVVFGAILPRSLKWIYVGWMIMAKFLSIIASSVILTVFFYLFVTPIGWIARLSGKDFLSRKRDSGATSYWILRDASKPKQKYEHEQQF